ncbi:YfhJ family protein [Alkalicoccobacillus murimartini]|uniref:Transposase-like protein n=1 Tax=Alkalicoccobacillus murimartini TaxID=171685 RepID=A0ABT9YK72_9BACI|nr:YfhJ family protein [Alkalicoccobacillus murimartini]MDQ0208264.1 transposase-like protein [Alkalicoccobacillus murimartini]
MESIFEQLAERLLARNSELSHEQARTWVESLWEDFDATRAKAGRPYRGPETTEAVVIKWIDQYGPYLHRYKPGQQKFNHLNG